MDFGEYLLSPHRNRQIRACVSGSLKILRIFFFHQAAIRQLLPIRTVKQGEYLVLKLGLLRLYLPYAQFSRRNLISKRNRAVI